MESNEKKRGIQENLTQLRARINELRVEMGIVIDWIFFKVDLLNKFIFNFRKSLSR